MHIVAYRILRFATLVVAGAALGAAGVLAWAVFG